MLRPSEVIVRVQSSWIEPSSWFHRGRGPVEPAWAHGYGCLYHRGRGPVMLRLDRAVCLSFRDVWSRLRPRSSQYTAFSKPSFQTSRGRHAAREIVSFNPYPSTTYASQMLGSIEVSKSLERTGSNHLFHKLGEPEGEPPEARLPKRGYPSMVKPEGEPAEVPPPKIREN
jgi:hypothetical protein